MPLLFLLFEALIFFTVVKAFGFWLTLLGYLAPSLIGVFLLTRMSQENWHDFQNMQLQSQNPQGEILKKAGHLMGAVFLVIPGFFTRLVGFILIFPWTRRLLIFTSKFWLVRRMSTQGFAFYQLGRGAFSVYNTRRGASMEDLRDVTGSGEVIDVKPIEIETELKSKS